MERIIANLSGHHEPQEELVFHYIYLNTQEKTALSLSLGHSGHITQTGILVQLKDHLHSALSQT
jgi:hypothetical protein